LHRKTVSLYARAHFPHTTSRGVFSIRLNLISRPLECWVKAGLNADLIFARLEEPDVKEQLRLNTEEAVRRGCSGRRRFLPEKKCFGATTG
jgi:2-hydroxychromene-2-carboxylate isomerase